MRGSRGKSTNKKKGGGQKARGRKPHKARSESIRVAKIEGEKEIRLGK